ncbi:MAG: hypothetical protein UR14_C0001G0001, partial [candidate division TM6 bacterium GW2011_GWE2_31_21]
AGHTIINASASNGVIVARLEDNTYKILTINPDKSLSSPQPLEIAGHTIEFARSTNGVIVAQLEDNTWRVFIPKRITLQQTLFVTAWKNKKILDLSNSIHSAIFESLPLKKQIELIQQNYVKPERKLNRFQKILKSIFNISI